MWEYLDLDPTMDGATIVLAWRKCRDTRMPFGCKTSQSCVDCLADLFAAVQEMAREDVSPGCANCPDIHGLRKMKGLTI